MSLQPELPVDEREMARRAFAEEFALVWALSGVPRMDGRILAYLMVASEPFVSSATLCEVLKISAGAVSTSTRRMVAEGFIRRHAVPGDRSHYFIASDDPWGSYLGSESVYLMRTRDVLAGQLEATPVDEFAARRRLRNGRNYMDWIVKAHKSILAEWEQYKNELGESEEREEKSSRSE